MATVQNDYFCDRNGERRLFREAIAEWSGAAFRSEDEVIAFLLNVLGYIRVRLTSRYCSAYVNTQSASDEAIIALIFCLSEYSEDFGGGIYVEDESGTSRRFDGWRSAGRYVFKITGTSSKLRRPSFVRNTISIDASAGAPFHNLVSICSPAEGLNQDLVREELRGRFANRYCVVKPRADSNRLILEEFGTGYDHIDKHWERRTVGTPFGEFEDAEYSRFVKKAYAEAWKLWRPVLDQVVICKEMQGVPQSYLRVLLPVIWNGERALLSAPLSDHGGISVGGGLTNCAG